MILTYLNQDMLAENEMDVQQYKRKVIDLDSWSVKKLQVTLPF
jgi:hypothetical protein